MQQGSDESLADCSAHGRTRLQKRFVARFLPLLLGMLASTIGCGSSQDLTYGYSDKMAGIATNHREQIQRGLLAHFGTPLFPRVRVLKASQNTETTSSESEGTRAEGQQAATINANDFDELFDPFVLQRGASIYRQKCAACHGITGDGAGKVAEHLRPRPRDYRSGVFKFISTSRSSKPRRADFERIILYGAKGTSMPSFRWLAEDELEAVIDYVMHLSMRGEVEKRLAIEAETELSDSDEITPDYFNEIVAEIRDSWVIPPENLVQAVTPQPAKSEETIEAGRRAFVTRGCQQCHNLDGRGRTSDVGRDEWGNLAYAADITAGTLHGGRRPIDIYRRIYTGINGTPMPGFGEALATEPETLWHMVHYVQELAAGRVFDQSDAEVLIKEAQTAGGVAPAAETQSSQPDASSDSSAELVGAAQPDEAAQPDAAAQPDVAAPPEPTAPVEAPAPAEVLAQPESQPSIDAPQ